MVDVSALLGKRFKSNSTKKMNELAKQSSNGQLSSFSGVFKTAPLSVPEKAMLSSILESYYDEDRDTEKDLEDLMNISSEVKAINTQAIILHGERIKRAQDILKNYREGAFTAWLIAAYGNRQTPYNFLQYFELSQTLPQFLQEKLGEMPKQAVYALASRDGENEKKEELIKTYNGEPKKIILERIRKVFPLKENDRRQKNPVSHAITTLTNIKRQIQEGYFTPTASEKMALKQLLDELLKQVT